jgi:hypothetical protein
MTWVLTFCMSTFWLNSGGNLVDFKSRWSVLDAMMSRSPTLVRRLYSSHGGAREREVAAKQTRADDEI